MKYKDKRSGSEVEIQEITSFPAFIRGVAVPKSQPYEVTEPNGNHYFISKERLDSQFETSSIKIELK